MGWFSLVSKFCLFGFLLSLKFADLVWIITSENFAGLVVSRAKNFRLGFFRAIIWQVRYGLWFLGRFGLFFELKFCWFVFVYFTGQNFTIFSVPRKNLPVWFDLITFSLRPKLGFFLCVSFQCQANISFELPKTYRIGPKSFETIKKYIRPHRI